MTPEFSFIYTKYPHLYLVFHPYPRPKNNSRDQELGTHFRRGYMKKGFFFNLRNNNREHHYKVSENCRVFWIPSCLLDYHLYIFSFRIIVILNENEKLGVCQMGTIHSCSI